MNDDKPKNIMRLFHDFQDEETANRLGPSLALVPPGRWDLLIQWATAHGYVFHGHDMADELAKRPAFVNRLAAHPTMKGWSSDSLSAYNASKS